MHKKHKVNGIELMFGGVGYLSTKQNKGVVRFFTSSQNATIPKIVEILGDTELLEDAWNAGTAVLAAFGTEIRVTVTGFSMKSGALTVRAAPVFEALAKQAKSAA